MDQKPKGKLKEKWQNKDREERHKTKHIPYFKTKLNVIFL